MHNRFHDADGRLLPVPVRYCELELFVIDAKECIQDIDTMIVILFSL